MKNVVFISSTFNQVGGGERLILEGIKFYSEKGFNVTLITWNYNEKSLINNKYKVPNLINLNSDNKFNINSYWFAARKLLKILEFRRILISLKPDFIISPSENDTTFLYLAMLFTKKKYSTLIFGQMFQIPEDPTRYSFVFRKHLKKIISSYVGYRETIPLRRPKQSFGKWFIIELWSILKYFAVKNSNSLIVFSKQVQWEVKLLYGRDAIIQKGGFRKADLISLTKLNNKFKDRPTQSVVLMVNRLEKKKRTHLALQAMYLLCQREVDVKLVIGGIGRELGILKKTAKDLNIENNVVFLGFVGENDLNDVIVSCDIFLSLDIADFNISPFSALVFQKPVIWTVEMDMDEFMLKSKLINVVEPVAEDVANTIERLSKISNATTSVVDLEFLNNYSYEKYFETVQFSLFGE